MMSTEERNWDLEAAEYVLGTVSAENRKVYDKLYEVDSDWRQRVHRWQSRLNPLHETTAPVKAPEHVLTAVMARIRMDGASEPVRSQAPEQSEQAKAKIPSASLHQSGLDARKFTERGQHVSSSAMVTLKEWQARVRYWQLATVLALASLAGVVVLGPGYLKRTMSESVMGRTVAVLQGEQKEPLWIISYRPETATGLSGVDSAELVSVTVVGDPELTKDQSHQLWMVLPEGSGVRSVGLVPNITGETATFVLPIPLKEAAEFAVSLEPAGGVPGPEHGPVVTRTFIIKPPSETEA